MLTIIIAIVLAIGLLTFCVDHNILEKSVTFICSAIIVLGIAFGVVIPVNGYTEWELTEETELVTLSNGLSSGGTGGIFYVSLSADNAYTYRYEIDSEFGTEIGKLIKPKHLLEKM